MEGTAIFVIILAVVMAVTISCLIIYHIFKFIIDIFNSCEPIKLIGTGMFFSGFMRDFSCNLGVKGENNGMNLDNKKCSKCKTKKDISEFTKK